MATTQVGVQMKCQLTLPDAAHLYGFIQQNAGAVSRGVRMVEAESGAGRRVAIVGAGPSLADTRFEIPDDIDEVWACNSALPYLVDRGHRVTHGFAIDQGEAMLRPHEWARTFDVTYLLASSVHPTLVDHLLAAGRRCAFFHSYLGMADPDGWVRPADRADDLTYEMLLYTGCYPTGLQAGYGLNAVPRAICLALGMGFREILVYGADCACVPDSPPMPRLGTPEYADWMAALVMYPDGRTASQYGAEAAMAEGVIDGRRWHTRPDMVISATMLCDLVRADPTRIRLVGDTLPAALLTQDAAFFESMPRLVGPGDVQGFGAHGYSSHLTLQAA